MVQQGGNAQKYVTKGNAGIRSPCKEHSLAGEAVGVHSQEACQRKVRESQVRAPAKELGKCSSRTREVFITKLKNRCCLPDFGELGKRAFRNSVPIRTRGIRPSACNVQIQKLSPSSDRFATREIVHRLDRTRDFVNRSDRTREPPTHSS